ncbi:MULTISPECIES: Bug family tripartite tricarboxylate transporter substrate binding protein [Halomonas]|uniref:Bug family tripartite tricarboxylate transporter substrate binding protein n=1 Tax=Halomonas TaxID=2745 RepID=UPI000EE93A68|nr:MULTISPECIES: tripartite tricarboxylate transporter substrate binding protein [Halomonas]HCR98936.1 tripartite tricarboxylate transporter substrate binding protein [Halomonas sp.]
MTKLSKTLLSSILVSTSLMAFTSQANAQAEDFPTKRINMIVPYSAGGSTDILARQVARGLTSVLDETVTVENRAGAGGTLGSTQAAMANPDGYTLFMGNVSSHGIAPAVYKNLQYDAKNDFDPIIYLLSIPNVMVVSNESNINSVEEFIDQANEREMRFASSGVGSSIHLSGEMFKARTGARMTHVPYRGSGQAMPALLSGDVDVMFENMPSALPQIQSGAIRPLAVTTSERSAALPDVPTLSEAGIAELEEFSAISWFGLFSPAGTDDAVVTKLNEAMQEVMQSDDFKEFARTRGATIEGGEPADLASHVDQELAQWKTVVDEAGVTVE